MTAKSLGSKLVKELRKKGRARRTVRTESRQPRRTSPTEAGQLVDDLRAGRICVEAVVHGLALGYPDEAETLRQVLGWAQDKARRKESAWCIASNRMIAAVCSLQGVQGRSGIDYQRGDPSFGLLDVKPRTFEEIHKTTATLLERLFDDRPGVYRWTVETPATPMRLTIDRHYDGGIALIWSIQHWRALYHTTLALLLHEYAGHLHRCPGPSCNHRVFLTDPGKRRGRPQTHCSRACNDRHRQRRHRQEKQA